jgi:putative ABC transport system substrate-binding protein
MKKITILMVVIVAALLILLLRKPSNENDKVIAIATLMSQPALDAVQHNLIGELTKEGYIEGKNVHYIIRNANGQQQLSASIASELVADNPDVIVPITTPMAQAVVAAKPKCPVVFAAVTDPVGAGIVKSLDTGEKNVTGTSDAWPYKDQLALIKKISPTVKRLGVLFNPGEAASQYGIKQIRKYAPALGYELVEGPVSSTNDVYAVAQNLASRVDALFLSSDNTVISGVAAALKVAVQHKIPLYVGDSGTVEKGGMAAVSVGYAELGVETGKLVARVLKGEHYIPTFVAHGSEIYLNTKAAQLMGVKIPQDVLSQATKIYTEIK